jgi:hypothetical protein
LNPIQVDRRQIPSSPGQSVSGRQKTMHTMCCVLFWGI